MMIHATASDSRLSARTSWFLLLAIVIASLPALVACAPPVPASPAELASALRRRRTVERKLRPGVNPSDGGIRAWDVHTQQPRNHHPIGPPLSLSQRRAFTLVRRSLQRPPISRLNLSPAHIRVAGAHPPSNRDRRPAACGGGLSHVSALRRHARRPPVWRRAGCDRNVRHGSGETLTTVATVVARRSTRPAIGCET